MHDLLSDLWLASRTVDPVNIENLLRAQCKLPALRWRCRRLAAACPVRLVGDIRHATAVVHKVFGQENKPGAPVTSSQGARDTNVRPPNRAWEERSIFPSFSRWRF